MPSRKWEQHEACLLRIRHNMFGGVLSANKKILKHVILSEARAKDLVSLCEARFFACGSE